MPDSKRMEAAIVSYTAAANEWGRLAYVRGQGNVTEILLTWHRLELAHAEMQMLAKEILAANNPGRQEGSECPKPKPKP